MKTLTGCLSLFWFQAGGWVHQGTFGTLKVVFHVSLSAEIVKMKQNLHLGDITFMRSLSPSPSLPLHALISSCRNRLSSSAAAARLWHNRHVCKLRAAQEDTRSLLFKTHNLWFLSPRRRRRSRRVVITLRRGSFFFLEGERLGGSKTR